MVCRLAAGTHDPGRSTCPLERTLRCSQKVCRANVESAGSNKEQAGTSTGPGRGADEALVHAQGLRHLAAVTAKVGWVKDHEVELLPRIPIATHRGSPARIGLEEVHNVRAPRLHPATHGVHGRRAATQLQRGLTRVHAEHTLGPVLRHGHAKAPHIAIEVQDARGLRCQRRQQRPVVSVVKVPAGLLAVEKVHGEGHSVLSDLRGPTVLALQHLAPQGRFLAAPAGGILADDDDLWPEDLLDGVCDGPQKGIEGSR
mmetsp:Transcript_120776/g.352773  ORF Transcript_120776/g.352773 Transcript_120776/m.352773 type:complete len:257 (-) Transcript_120776:602-1372(-)